MTTSNDAAASATTFGERFAALRISAPANVRGAQAQSAPPVEVFAAWRILIVLWLPFIGFAFSSFLFYFSLMFGALLYLATNLYILWAWQAPFLGIASTVDGLLKGQRLEAKRFDAWPPEGRFIFVAGPLLLLIGFLMQIASHINVYLNGPLGWAYFLIPPLGGWFSEKIIGALDGMRLVAPPDEFEDLLPSAGAKSGETVVAERSESEPHPFGIVLGTSRGKLVESVGHAHAIAAGSPVVLGALDLAKNLLITGETGTGKTTHFINSFAVQATRQGAGGLIIDTTKGGELTTMMRDLLEAEFAAEGKGRRVVVFGHVDEHVSNSLPWNPIIGKEPAILAANMRALLSRRSAPSGERATWVNAGVSCSTSIFGLLSIFRDGTELSLRNAQRFLNANAFRGAEEEWAKAYADDEGMAPADYQMLVLREARAELEKAKGRDPEREEHILTYLEAWGRFLAYTPTLQSSIRFSSAEIFSPFDDPGVARRFCRTASREGDPIVNFHDILERGDVLILYAPASAMGDVGAAAVSVLAKMEFRRLMLRRRSKSAWNQTRFVFNILDEFTRSLITADIDEGDTSFFGISRSSGCCTVAATQAYSSIRAAIGDEAMTQSLVQAFVLKVTMKTSDPLTIETFNKLFGKFDHDRTTISVSESEGTSAGGSGGGSNEGSSRSISTAPERRDLIDAPWMAANLKRGEALISVSIGGEMYEDVIYAPQVLPESAIV